MLLLIINLLLQLEGALQESESIMKPCVSLSAFFLLIDAAYPLSLARISYYLSVYSQTKSEYAITSLSLLSKSGMFIFQGRKML